MKKNNILKLVLTIIALAALISVVILIGRGFSSKSDGTITVEVVALDRSIIKSKDIDFNEGEKLVDLIQSNFDNVVVEGTMIMAIEDYTTPSDWSTFLSIKVDGVESMVGITEIEFTDGTKISLVITEFIYE